MRGTDLADSVIAATLQLQVGQSAEAADMLAGGSKRAFVAAATRERRQLVQMLQVNMAGKRPSRKFIRERARLSTGPPTASHDSMPCSR
jgi:thioredoxin-like negative regulator of GroEL